MGLLQILYRDDHLVAINKPESLIVHRGRKSPDQIAALQLVRDQVGQYVYLIHRLDRPTSGVLLFALNKKAAAGTQRQFESREVSKEYLAVVRGFAEPEDEIDYAYVEEPGDRPRSAVTRYGRLATAEREASIGEHRTVRYSLLEVRPETGRMHQIRRHMKHISHPVIGDTQHGDSLHNRYFREEFGCFRMLLHARRLSLLHPVTQAPLVITAPVAPDMLPVLNQLGWGGMVAGD